MKKIVSVPRTRTRRSGARAASKVRLSVDERWEVFLAWCKSERSKYSFVPARSTWRQNAQKLGISVEKFEEWADGLQWSQYP